MASGDFTIADLRRILHAASGEVDGADVQAETMDTGFARLGYDSLALLETYSRIEREFGVTLDDSALLDTATPRVLIEAVNAQLALDEAAKSPVKDMSRTDR